MKVLGIAFSARKRGNCLNCIDFVLTKLREQGFETDVINAYGCEIKPCSHCNYECFAHELRGKDEECPIQDDVPRIYSKVKEDVMAFRRDYQKVHYCFENATEAYKYIKIR